jgi:hypothetical protein
MVHAELIVNWTAAELLTVAELVGVPAVTNTQVCRAYPATDISDPEMLVGVPRERPTAHAVGLVAAAPPIAQLSSLACKY